MDDIPIPTLNMTHRLRPDTPESLNLLYSMSNDTRFPKTPKNHWI